MTFASAIRAHLLADSAIAAMVGEQIYPVLYPQMDQSTAQFPAILHRLLDAFSLTPIEAEVGTVDMLWETQRRFEILAETYDAVETLSGLLAARLHASSNLVFSGTGPDIAIVSCVLATASDQVIVGSGVNPFSLFVRYLHFDVVTRGAFPL